MAAQYFVEECRSLDEWQSFVNSSPLGNIFQTRDWAEALKEAGFKTLLIVARDSRENILGGMLTSYKVYSLMGFSIIPSISAVGGPLLSNTNDQQLLERIFKFFDARGKRLGALHAFIRSFSPLDKVLVNKLNYVMEYDCLPCTVIQDLTKSTQDVWKNMERAGRRAIRKAEKAGVSIEEGENLGDLKKYHTLQIKTSNRLKIRVKSLQIYRAIWEVFHSRNDVKVFLANYGNKTIAGCIILRWNDKIWYWDSASIPDYWHLYPNDLLQWYVMKWGINEGIKTYDFLGIPCRGDRKHPKYGLYRFKAKFGGKIVRHGEYVKQYFRLRSILLGRLQPLYIRFSALCMPVRGRGTQMGRQVE